MMIWWMMLIFFCFFTAPRNAAESSKPCRGIREILPRNSGGPDDKWIMFKKSETLGFAFNPDS